MSDTTIKTWVNLEKGNYTDFHPQVAQMMETAMHTATQEYLRRKLNESGHAELALPYGTYYADFKDQNGSTVVDISWEPSAGLKKMLNDQSDSSNKFDQNYMSEFDSLFLKLFTDKLAYGKFDPTNEDKADSSKLGIYLEEFEVPYFLNSYMQVLYNIAKDKQREGKKYRLEIGESSYHGVFEFSYTDKGIDVIFIPDKVFKQHLKDDAASSKVTGGEFAPAV